MAAGAAVPYTYETFAQWYRLNKYEEERQAVLEEGEGPYAIWDQPMSNTGWSVLEEFMLVLWKLEDDREDINLGLPAYIDEVRDEVVRLAEALTDIDAEKLQSLYDSWVADEMGYEITLKEFSQLAFILYEALTNDNSPFLALGNQILNANGNMVPEDQ